MPTEYTSLPSDALHETCRSEWRAIAAVDPERQFTQHSTDAHYGLAHDLVRRLGLAAEPSAVAVLRDALDNLWLNPTDEASRNAAFRVLTHTTYCGVKGGEAVYTDLSRCSCDVAGLIAAIEAEAAEPSAVAVLRDQLHRQWMRHRRALEGKPA